MFLDKSGGHDGDLDAVEMLLFLHCIRRLVHDTEYIPGIYGIGTAVTRSFLYASFHLSYYPLVLHHGNTLIVCLYSPGNGHEAC